MDRPLSLAALTVIELTPPEVVKCAALAGYSHVGLRLLPVTPREPSFEILGDTPMRRELQRVLADTGVKVLDVEFIRLDATIVLSTLLPLLETAALLGARNVLLAGFDADEARFVDRFAQLCDLAAPYSLNVNLEFYPWAEVNSLSKAHRAVVASGRANAGILVDSLHFDRTRATFAELDAVPEALLRYVQLCDAPATRPATTDALIHQARAERLYPGEGGLDLLGLLQHLPRELSIGIEAPTRERALTVAPVERARRARAATLQLLSQLESADRARKEPNTAVTQ
ncbi:MAG: TIM barrel protein [Betaproteobacteria bacterium]